MQKFLAALRGFLARVRTVVAPLWRRFRTFPKWAQIIIGLIVFVLIIALLMALTHQTPKDTGNGARTVVVRSVAELSGGGDGTSVIGTVRSESEAALMAESGGTVRSVNATLGQSVGAGFVIAELENDSQRAAVLQAEGAYDAAVAARSAVSPEDATAKARSVYRDAFSTLDTALQTEVDAFFGNQKATGPRLLISAVGDDADSISRERQAIEDLMNAWRAALPGVNNADPANLLTAAERDTTRVQALVERIAKSANRESSGATDAQMTSLAAARASVNGVLSSVVSAQASYRSGSTSSTASVDAGVKSALGTLRAAQANLEKTRIRAPIAGTVNFMPLRVGDYVTQLEHVATVAQNGALEIVAYVSEDARASIAVGTKVLVEGEKEGVITQIAPALDPITKQIELHVALTGDAAGIVNGQSVRIALPNASATTTAAGPVLLPLTALKLTPTARVVFSIGEDGRLVAHPVEIADVRGDRIEIRSGITPDVRIVVDARGLSEGQQVHIAQ